MRATPQLALPGVVPDARQSGSGCEESDDVSDEAGFDHQAVMKSEVVLSLAPRRAASTSTSPSGAAGTRSACSTAGRVE